MKGFGSDNHAPIHPKILEHIIKVNSEHAPSYGVDDVSAAAEKIFKKHFGDQSEIFWVFNGTAANCLSLRALMKPAESVFCSDISHLNVDESAAPEFFSAGKLIPLPTTDGKIKLSDLEKNWIRKGDQHYAQTTVLSLTQPTELGTCYSYEELKQLCQWAKQKGLFIHIDGTRLTNACMFLNKTYKELTTDLKVDVVSFGGTKNSLLAGEAVVFLTPGLAKNFKWLRKQAGQLPSKTRFIAAQFLGYFEIYEEIARHVLHGAQVLKNEIEKLNLPQISICYPVESNAVFVKIPQPWIKPLRENSFFYVWDEEEMICRWMISWDITENDIQKFVLRLKEIAREIPAH